MTDNEPANADLGPENRGEFSQKAPQPGTSHVTIVRETQSPLGRVELRRRWSLALHEHVYELLVNGDLMMSSAVHVSEDALAERSLAETLDGDLKVLIGGLGLGFTPIRVLDDPRVRSVTVVELLAPVVEWHRERVFPWSGRLFSDNRLEIIQADCFDLLTRPATSATRYDLILVDIDDGPEDAWHASHAEFYTDRGLQAAVEHLRPGGVLAFWFAVRPDEAFLGLIGKVLQSPRIESISFTDPCLHRSQEHFLVLGRRLAPGAAN